MAAQREWYEKDYYKVLGVGEDSTAKEITKAYRKLARELHPDKNPGDAAAEERFKEVAAAYDVLGDETKRAEYDEVRRMGPMSMGGRPGGGPGGFTFNVGDMDGGLGDIFGNLFGRRGGTAGGRRESARSGSRVQAHVAAPTSRRCSPSSSPTPSAASRPRCISRPTRSARPATARVPSPARARGCVPTVVGVASSTTTRACSRSRRRAACARGRAPSSTSRAPPVVASASRSGRARFVPASPRA